MGENLRRSIMNAPSYSELKAYDALSLPTKEIDVAEVDRHALETG